MMRTAILRVFAMACVLAGIASGASAAEWLGLDSTVAGARTLSYRLK
jgi:hypothetical protein